MEVTHIALFPSQCGGRTDNGEPADERMPKKLSASQRGVGSVGWARAFSISSTIATAVEEQNATTHEMARNLGEAARGNG